MRLIDADALFDNILEAYGTAIDESEANFFMRMINCAPIINPKSLWPQWIPFLWRKTTKEDGWDPEEFPLMACGELPENGQDILVTNGCHVWSDTFFDDNGLYLDSGNDLTEDVTAWMPLPEPYTGGNNHAE